MLLKTNVDSRVRPCFGTCAVLLTQDSPVVSYNAIRLCGFSIIMRMPDRNAAISYNPSLYSELSRNETLII